MTVSATSIRFDEHTMWLDLTDGRTLGVPLAWFPRLLNATPAQRQRVEISRVGLHWEDLDEDISIAGLLVEHRTVEGHDLPTSAELAGIDRGLRDAVDGRFATHEQVEAALTKLRGA